MIAIHAMADDYERWASAYGNPGWSFDDILPARRRMEADPQLPRRALPRRRRPDPRPAPPREDWGPADNALAEAAAAQGTRWCEDHNAPTGTGISPYGINAARRRARHRERRLPRAARGRSNLRIVGDTLVDRCCSRAGGRAASAHASAASGSRCAPSTSCCPPARSARRPILLRSGVGPDGSVARLPVGEGAQEHPLALFWLFARPEQGARSSTSARSTACCATRPVWPAPARTT
jgi:choline dehydrogenase/5-(hydroxymethyl)furfural/furfural oxidase